NNNSPTKQNFLTHYVFYDKVRCTNYQSYKELSRMNQLTMYTIYVMANKLAMSSLEIVYTVRLAEMFGLNNQQILTLSSIYCLISLIMEIPTGYFADKFGAKKSIVAGAGFWLLAQASIAFGSQYWHFIVGQVLMSIGGAFLSGALDCWLGDNFKTNDQFSFYKRNLNQKIRLITMLVAVVAGFTAKNYNYNIPYYFGLVLFSLSFLATFFFNEVKERPGKKPTIFNSLNDYFSNYKAVSLGILAFFNAMTMSSLFMLYSLVVKIDMQYGVEYVSYMYIATSIFMLVAGKVEMKLSKKFEEKPFVTELILQISKGLSVVLLGLMVSFGFIPFVIAFLMMQMIAEINGQFMSLHLNGYFKGKNNEATLNSIHQFIYRCGGMIGYFTMGMLADSVGRQNTLYAIGLTIVMSAILMTSYYNFSKKIAKE
ncbi:MAG: MFS transporter, partial [Patescibacteria group bacterium]